MKVERKRNPVVKYLKLFNKEEFHIDRKKKSKKGYKKHRHQDDAKVAA
jgi:hypothetical protein